MKISIMPSERGLVSWFNSLPFKYKLDIWKTFANDFKE